MTLLRLLRQVRVFYPLLSVYDLLIAGLEKLLYQNQPKHGLIVSAWFKAEMEYLNMDTTNIIGVPWIKETFEKISKEK